MYICIYIFALFFPPNLFFSICEKSFSKIIDTFFSDIFLWVKIKNFYTPYLTYINKTNVPNFSFLFLFLIFNRFLNLFILLFKYIFFLFGYLSKAKKTLPKITKVRRRNSWFILI